MTRKNSFPVETYSPFMAIVAHPQGVTRAKVEFQEVYPHARLSYSRKNFLTYQGLTPKECRQARESEGWIFCSFVGEVLQKEKNLEALESKLADVTFLWKRPGLEDQDFMITPQNPLKTLKLTHGILQSDPENYFLVKGFAPTWSLTEAELPESAPSRAYLKIREAHLSFQLPLRKGDRVLELGSSPGGISKYLLEQGMWVWGVDTAKMDDRVLSHPQFTNLKRPAQTLSQELMQKIDPHWILVDVNLSPDWSLMHIKDLSKDLKHLKGVGVNLKLGSAWEKKTTAQLLRFLHAKIINPMNFRRWGLKQLSSHQKEVFFYGLF